MSETKPREFFVVYDELDKPFDIHESEGDADYQYISVMHREGRVGAVREVTPDTLTVTREDWEKVKGSLRALEDLVDKNSFGFDGHALQARYDKALKIMEAYD